MPFVLLREALRELFKPNFVHFVRFLALAAIVAMLSVPAKSDLVSFETAKTHHSLKPFLGTYEMISKNDRGTIATLHIENRTLYIDYLAYSERTPYVLMELPLPFRDRNREWGFSENFGRAYVTEKTRITDNALEHKTIHETRFFRSEEIFAMGFNENHELTVQHKRSYFRRKFLVSGPWVPDRFTVNAKYNSVFLSRTLVRTSESPLSSDELERIGKTRRESEIHLRGNPRGKNLIKSLLEGDLKAKLVFEGEEGFEALKGELVEYEEFDQRRCLRILQGI